MKVGFIGLGKLGMPCAEAMANVYNVTGYDIHTRQSDKITISDSLRGAVTGKDIIFVAVQTPHDPAYDGSQPITHLPNKDFDYSDVKSVLKDIDDWASPDQLVVLISTVLPGTVRRELKECISIPRFIYNPYLIAMGSVQWDMLNPEMVIIGTKDGDENSEAKELISFYQPLMENNPRYVVGTWDEAESIKIFYNTFISTKISLVNMIQDVAMKNGNINVDVVTDALARSTTRIMGSKYMTAGMGDAGPCHPRDNIALRWLAENLNLGYDIFDTIMHAREMQARNLAKYLKKIQIQYNLPIFIMGKSYKPDVEYCDGSYSILLGHYLDEIQAKYFYIDPLTEDCAPFKNVPVIVFLAHNREITYGYTGQQQTQNFYCEIETGSVIIDPWRKFPKNHLEYKVIHYGNTRNISN
jgi:UDPglucose 6-dehydrogenase